jgi:hypothetical protein
MTWDLLNHAHAHAALLQGWQLVETGFPGGNEIQIQDVIHVHDAHVNGDLVPRLGSHQAAMKAMKQAYERGEDHAIQAYQLLKSHAHSEFTYWHMQHWQIVA